MSSSAFARLACVSTVAAALVCAAGAPAASAEAAQEIALSGVDAAAAPVLDEAQRLIGERRAREAYALLAARELDLAGAPYFDYLLGLAALDAGRPRDAVFALERVVAVEPAFVGARMELARAHFELGEVDASREQFRYLLTQAPPAPTRAVIERYLGALDERRRARDSRWTGLLQFGGGYDTNANGSTDEQQFLGFTLDPRNVAIESGFGEIVAGLGNRLALGADAGLVTSLQASHRANADASFVDQTVGSLGSTYVRRIGRARFTIGASGYYGYLDGEAHDWAVNADVGVSRRSGDWEIAGNVRAGQQRYLLDRLEILDVDRLLAGLSLARVDIGQGSGRIGLALIGGRDDERRPGSPYGNDRYGARLFAGRLLAPQSSVYFEASALRSDYEDGAFFGGDRRDDQYGALLSFDFQNWPAAYWSVSPRIRYVQNDSTIALYEYDRVEAALFVRRSF
jgi:tetratricopeptide (TPR) repeat protein